MPAQTIAATKRAPTNTAPASVPNVPTARDASPLNASSPGVAIQSALPPTRGPLAFITTRPAQSPSAVPAGIAAMMEARKRARLVHQTDTSPPTTTSAPK